MTKPEARTADASNLNPIGEDVAVARARRRRDPKYVEIERQLAPYEHLARLLITYRIEHGLTQRQLADLVGTSETAISRLESGQHAPTVETLRRVGEGLGQRLVIGFEDKSGTRELAIVGG